MLLPTPSSSSCLPDMPLLSDRKAIEYANGQSNLCWKLVRYDGASRRAVFYGSGGALTQFLVAREVTAWRYTHPQGTCSFQLRSDASNGYGLDISASNGAQSVFSCESIQLYASEDLRYDLELAVPSSRFENQGYVRDERTAHAVATHTLNTVQNGYRIEQVQVVAYSGNLSDYDECLLKVETIRTREEEPEETRSPLPRKSWWIICGGLKTCELNVQMPAQSLTLGKGGLPGEEDQSGQALLIDNGTNARYFVTGDRFYVHEADEEDPHLPIKGRDKGSRLSEFGQKSVWQNGPPLNQL